MVQLYIVWCLAVDTLTLCTLAEVIRLIWLDVDCLSLFSAALQRLQCTRSNKWSMVVEFDPRPLHSLSICRLVLGGVTIFGQVYHLGIQAATQTNLASYPLWDGKWIPAKVRWCALRDLGRKCRVAHSIRG